MTNPYTTHIHASTQKSSKLLLCPVQQPLCPLRILRDELPQHRFASSIVAPRRGRARSGAHA